MIDDDLLLLMKYAPDQASLATWTPERADDILGGLFGTSSALPLMRVAPGRRRIMRWAPALAAACVLTLVVGLGLAFGTGGGSPSGGSHTPTLQIHPWHARSVHSLPFAGTLLGHGSDLWFLDSASKPALLEIDPDSGAVLARAAIPRTGSLEAPVWAGGRVWLATQTSRTGLRLIGFSPDLSTSIHRTIDLPIIHRNVAFDLTSPADGSTLYVSNGSRVLVLDPATGRTRSHIAISAGDISVSPDGATLYVMNANHARISSVDTRTQHVRKLGRVRGDESRTFDSGDLNSLGATDDGYFVSAQLISRPNVLTPLYYPAAGSPRVRVAVGNGIPFSPTQATGGVSLGSGGSQVSCVDSSTGQVLARSAVPRHPNSVTIDLAEVGGTLYGSYAESGLHGTRALIELTPPKACRLSS